MMRRSSPVLLTIAALVSNAIFFPALADEARGAGPQLRIGGFYHSLSMPESGTADVQISGLFPAFDLGPSMAASDVTIHPELGADLNTQGKTSAAFAGFAAVAHLPANFLAEANLGVSANNGYTSGAPSGRLELGCNELFREALGLGYQFTKQVSVMAVAEHMSNANLCQPNNGITNVGLRLGYSF